MPTNPLTAGYQPIVRTVVGPPPFGGSSAMRPGAPEEKMRDALHAIRRITGETQRERPYTALSEIDPLKAASLGL
jgi:hypothetical protein